MKLRALLFCMLLATVVGTVAAQDGQTRFKGRTIASVLEEFRTRDSIPFAYSTSLVTDTLLVTIEPDATSELDIVKQILEPHCLKLRSEEGFWLIVRNDACPRRVGEIRLIIRDKNMALPIEYPVIRSSPELPQGSQLTPGVRQYSAVPPATYRIEVGAEGYAPANRVVYVNGGKSTELLIDLEPARPEMENITVSASRYELSREIGNSRFDLDQRTIQNLPDVGEDPVRATHRLPGAAASGASARSYFRGGEEAETGIILNGQRLFDPFHVRDYQNIFSTIDSRAIDGVEVYTGGFPVRYGDRLSGMVLMESLEATKPRHTEIGLSVFNTSVLTAGMDADTDTQWLFSARRGNLDLVIDPRFGRPRYYDLFGEFVLRLTPHTRLSANALYADDSVNVVLETVPEEREEATSKTRNAQFWLIMETDWNDYLSSSTVLSVNSFSNSRVGFTRDPETVVSDVDDRRKVDEFGFRQDWLWSEKENHLLQWGFEAQHSEAQYDYVADAEFFGLKAMFEDVPTTISRDLAAAPSGDRYAVYLADKWKLAERTILEFGLRWDHQAYTDMEPDSQLSPRLSILHAFSPRTEIRFSWGRYYQSQGIHELQIEDGVTTFFPAQRADHIIAGIRQQLGRSHSLRLEVFQKDMQGLRPRFENLYDPLALIPELQPDRVRIAPDSARSRGLELSLSRNEGALTWWATYSLAEVYDVIAGREEARSWDQRHALQAGLNWSKDAWEFALAGHVRSGWPTTGLALEEVIDINGEIETIAVPGPRNAEHHPTFTSVDARISRRYDVGRGSLLLFLEVSNMFNRENICCRDYDIEEDENGEDVLELSYDFWLPLLPAVGFLWEF